VYVSLQISHARFISWADHSDAPFLTRGRHV
jgi:hypothetical protein